MLDEDSLAIRQRKIRTDVWSGGWKTGEQVRALMRDEDYKSPSHMEGRDS